LKLCFGTSTMPILPALVSTIPALVGCRPETVTGSHPRDGFLVQLIAAEWAEVGEDGHSTLQSEHGFSWVNSNHDENQDDG
jgi:hypothetical protein